MRHQNMIRHSTATHLLESGVVVPTIVGIDHGFSSPIRYFEAHHLLPNWPSFLNDFQRHWPMDENHTYVDFVRDVLLEAWRKAEGLCGRPDILRINRHLALASPELVWDMAKIEVQVEVADAKEKSLPASLRSAQNSSRWLLGKHDRKDPSLTGSIQALCRDAQYDHDFHVRSGYRGAHSREVKNRMQQWLALPA